MKTKKRDRWQVAGGRTNNAAAGAGLIRPSPFALRPFPAFTLIELLVVISIIALLAAFTMPVMKQLKRREYINKTQAEMAKLETAIDSYKAAYGFYPPGNPGYSPANSTTWGDAFFHPLYFELMGTTNTSPANPATGTYQTLDGSATIPADATGLTMPPAPGPLGVSGFINCTKPNVGEDAVAAKIFLPDLSSKQIAFNNTNLPSYPNVPLPLLVASVGGPDINYQPLGASGVNPWRYVYPGIKNPTSYDLWVDLCIAGQTNLICNWTKEVQKNTTLP
jgi:prepilin-type N-terminal cleavage/methylation domain-containing protein